MQLKYHGISYSQDDVNERNSIHGVSGVYRGQVMTFSSDSQRPVIEQHQLTYRGVSYPEGSDRQRLTQRRMEPSLSA